MCMIISIEELEGLNSVQSVEHDSAVRISTFNCGSELKFRACRTLQYWESVIVSIIDFKEQETILVEH